MKVKLIALGIILSLAIPVSPIAETAYVYADNGEQESAHEQNVIYPSLEEILAGLSHTDNISVIVYLKRDPSLDRQIQAIWQGQPDDEMHTISESLKQKYRNVSAEMMPYEEQLRTGDPDALERYKELLEKYGINDDSTRAAVQRLNELHGAKIEQVEALHEQAYSDMQQQAKQRIEQIPDTTIPSSTFLFNNLVVETTAGNIQALAAIPDVVKISHNSRLVWPITHFNPGAPIPLSPVNNSPGTPMSKLSFSWKPLNETKRYKFVLSRDAAMTQVVKEAEVTATSYEYDGTLDYGTNYFWRVMALEPAPSDWSPTFSFRTEAETQKPTSKWKTFIFSLQQKIREIWHR